MKSKMRKAKSPCGGASIPGGDIKEGNLWIHGIGSGGSKCYEKK